MKIIQMVPYFYPAWAYGGPAKLVYDTSCYFASQGHEVVVLTSDSYDREHRMPENKKVNGISHLKVRYFKNFHNTLAYVYNIFFTPAMFLSAILEVKNADIVHLHDFYTPQHAWLGLLCWIFHTPYILSVHGCLEEKRMQQRSLFKQLCLVTFGNKLLRGASAVMATSDNEIRAYKAYGVQSERIQRLGHGVSPEEFMTQKSKKYCRKRLGLPESGVVATFLGRIHAIKGLDLLVQAVDKLRDKKIRFVIAGSDDGYLATLKEDIKKRRLQDSITLIGTCFGEQKAQLFKASDMFVYPSYSEGFSLGILEAAAAGLPLLITEGCHFSQVQSEHAGMVIKSDASALAAAIMKLANNTQERVQFGKHAKLLVERRYSMDAIGKKLLRIYSQAAQ